MRVITKEDIKAWLKATGKTRQDLADAMGASKGTINNWLSGADPIPALKLQLIERIMNETENQNPILAINDISAFALMLSTADKEFLIEAAKLRGMAFEEFVLRSAMDSARNILKEN